MAYHLSQRSRRELVGVHPALVHLVHAAIARTNQDFGVHDGLRDLADQQAMVDSGASRTLDSYHRAQETTGYGHAVDLVPYVRGRLRWEWEPIYQVTTAMRLVADEMGVADCVRWGGCWKLLSDLGNPEDDVAAYMERKRKAAKRAFADGPHFELLHVPVGPWPQVAPAS